MEDKFELTYSPDALLSRVLFLSSNENINIFVEDMEKEYEYEEIFEQILSPVINISCIFPTGGKRFLEEAYDLFGKSDKYGKCFFIADGDFDKVLNKPMIKADNFLYLNRYNIESYLIHKESVVLYMRPKLKQTLKQTEQTLCLDLWLNNISPFLKKIFALHCVVQKKCPGIKNVDRGPERFFSAQGQPNEEAYNDYKNEIDSKVKNLDNEIDIALVELEKIYGDETSSFVCGKYYIYGLKLMLNTKLSKKINPSELKAGLINHIKVEDLKYVEEKLINYLQLSA